MPDRDKPSKLFTVEQANATLPLVRAITADLVRLSRDVIERRKRLEHLTAGREAGNSDPYQDELVQFKEDLDQDSRLLQEYARELQELGVELKSAPDGLIDFPSRLDDRLVYLCWKLGEPEVLHWHEMEDGFAGRRPLVAPAVADDGPGMDA